METANRSIFCFYAIPDGKPLALFLQLLEGSNYA
jgi:hypothetical protein